MNEVLPGTVHVGDVGALIEETLTFTAGGAVDLTDAPRIDILFRTPSQQFFRRAAAPSGAPNLGVAVYATVAGDLSEWGEWRYQFDVELVDGTKFRSRIHAFQVEKILGPFPITIRAEPGVFRLSAVAPVVA